MSTVRIDHAVTSGTFSLDGGTWEVDNNLWVIGDDTECLVIDPAHDLDAVARLVDGRTVRRILLTHAHDDHSKLAPEASRRFEAPISLHVNESPLWLMANADSDITPEPLEDGQTFRVGDQDLEVLLTPGHSPGSVCFYGKGLTWEGKGPVVFSGDTLFQGGPGATGRSYSDFPTIIASITDRLLVLPEETVVLTGHGDPTRIGEEAPHRQEWIDRGE